MANGPTFILWVGNIVVAPVQPLKKLVSVAYKGETVQCLMCKMYIGVHHCQPEKKQNCVRQLVCWKNSNALIK